MVVHQSELLLACRLGAGVEVVEVESEFACVVAAAWAMRMQRTESMTLNPQLVLDILLFKTLLSQL